MIAGCVRATTSPVVHGAQPAVMALKGLADLC
jgi:hypothetical protein